MNRIVITLISITALVGSFFFGYYWYQNNHECGYNITVMPGDTAKIPVGISGYVGLGKVKGSDAWITNADPDCFDTLSAPNYDTVLDRYFLYHRPGDRCPTLKDTLGFLVNDTFAYKVDKYGRIIKVLK